MATAINAIASGASVQPDAQTAGTKTFTADKEAFLKLLVSQIKNQNPLNPADGAEFVTQLAQFSQLEQTIGIREDIAAIRDALAPRAGQAEMATPAASEEQAKGA